ncbi:unnamed protein product [Cylindrotheca closterium]|uniref:PS II complex 12 kDa extrinsic protein n=1 Tax=Cylindrotheca closterium TaxID=2856 RepID=A0AAD2CRW9_9STRA|nr:unnamed protein product [Cylindrotheca closterium]
MKFTLYLLVFIVGCKYTESLSNYLETLSKESRVDEPDPAYSRPEDIVPEEYYGFTNPMANNWPGSKHEKYGAYLKKIEPTRVGGSVAPAANSWRSETSTPKAQGHGSYLDSL